MVVNNKTKIKKQMSNTTHDLTGLRQRCWSQYKEPYNRFNNFFSEPTNGFNFSTIHYTELFKELGINSKVIACQKPKKFICRCMDERCQQLNQDDEVQEGDLCVSIAIPGMGSLLNKDLLEEHAKIIMKKADENGVETIELYSHQGCGAAALAKPFYIQETGNQNPTAREVEIYFGERAYSTFCKVKEAQGFKVKIAEHQYQSSDMMMHIDNECSDFIHPALGVAIMDFQGLDLSCEHPSIHDFLNQAQLPFFLVTDYGSHFDDKKDKHLTKWRSTAREVELASHIMQGDHGMGSDFTLPIIFLVNSFESKSRVIDIMSAMDKQLNLTKFANTADKPNHHKYIMVDFMKKTN
jgi:hypothetical protein